MHQVSLKHRDEYFRGSTLIPADAGTSLQDSDTPFRNSLPLWLTLSQIRFSVLTRGTFIFNVQYLVILNISLVYADCQELLGSDCTLSFGLFGSGSVAERNGISTFVSREFDTYESKKHPERPIGLIFFVKFIGYILRDLA